MSETLLWCALVGLALAATLAAARLGGWLFVRIRQPEVVGEIAFGLLAGPLLVWAGGGGARELLFGAGRLEALTLIAHAGLVLFMVGVGHELKSGPVLHRARSLTGTALGTLLLPAACGLLLAAWVDGQGGALRGDTPAPAFLLVMAVALTVTAVPVLARFLQERGLMGTPGARLSLGSSALVDLVAWAGLALAIAMADGSPTTVAWRVLALLAIGGVAAVLARVLRRVAVPPGPLWVRVVLVGLAAVGLSLVARAVGFNEILLALALGLALPARARTGSWTPAIETLARGGRLLVPVFFFVTGLGVFASGVSTVPWAAAGLAVVLAVVGKLAGSYVGARLGGCPQGLALEVGVLLNTRGLTELVVLQTAFAAGLLSPGLYLALVLMTLVTTMMTSPLHNWLTRRGLTGGGAPSVAATVPPAGRDLPERTIA